MNAKKQRVVNLKVTTLKSALMKWQKDHEEDYTKAKLISLDSFDPPLEKITPDVMSKARQCRHLILSNNLIQKISGLDGLRNLRILNLSRNNLSSLVGIECLGRTLEELWVSYNYIEKLKPIASMRNLKVLLLSHNDVNNWLELSHLASLPNLTSLSFCSNPLQRILMEDDYRKEVIKRLPKLRSLDFQPTNMEN